MTAPTEQQIEAADDHDIVVLAQTYLAMNAAESGSDVLIAGLIQEVERLRLAAAAPEPPSLIRDLIHAKDLINEMLRQEAAKLDADSDAALAEEAEGWQPIETAPHGPWLLLAGLTPTDREFACVGRHNANGVWVNDTFSTIPNPTHWIELPAPPTVTNATDVRGEQGDGK